MRISLTEDAILKCPLCDFDYVRLDTVTASTASGRALIVRASGEDETSTVVAEPTRSVEDRRFAFELSGRCGSSHDVRIRFTQHKGQTFVDVKAVDTPS